MFPSTLLILEKKGTSTLLDPKGNQDCSPKSYKRIGKCKDMDHLKKKKKKKKTLQVQELVEKQYV